MKTIKYKDGVRFSESNVEDVGIPVSEESAVAKDILKSNGKESKHERFLRLASARTESVLQKLRVLGNCANKVQYEYEDGDVSSIFEAIESQVATIKEKFKRAGLVKQFSLK